jgi:hypothetical protein
LVVVVQPTTKKNRFLPSGCEAKNMKPFCSGYEKELNSLGFSTAEIGAIEWGAVTHGRYTTL